MSNYLVTGSRGGVEHVTSDQARNFHAGIAGDGRYVMSGLTATMQSANTCRIAPGVACFNGADVEVPAGGADVTIENGTQGMKRNDLVVLRYSEDSGIESVDLAVIKGTPDASSPEDPAYNDGSILEGDDPVDMPLWRIPLDGVSVGTPEPLFDVLTPMAELRDLVSQGIVGAATLMLTSDITAPIGGDYAQGSFRKISGFGPITINDQGQVVFGRAGSALLVGQACVTDVSAGDLCHLRVGLTVDWHSQFRASGDYDTFSVAPGMIPVSAGQTFRPWYRCEQGGGSKLYAGISQFTFLLFGK